ncbi:hypothetical protein [Saccharothrix sp. HUAS TT1]|uniref:hypothetical protein n=1 Tax=unclassified Saccharothrix TaxID=2593673 RepID=UPI00345C119B
MTRSSPMPQDERGPVRYLFDRTPVGRGAVEAAGGDEDYAIWLVELIQTHWRVGHRPVDDLHDPKWRGFYDRDLPACDAIRHAEVVPPPLPTRPRWERR